MQNRLRILCGIITLVFLASPQLSFADWSVGVRVGGHDHERPLYRWHDHPRLGMRIRYLPAGYTTVRAGWHTYYYYDGLYYDFIRGQYVLVNPPLGAYVAAIPADFQAVVINGRRYYRDRGVYYIFTRRHGYKVVRAPVVVVRRY